MTLFDKVIQAYPEFPGYRGDVPVTKQDYNTIDWFSEWQKPTWEVVQEEIAKLNWQDKRARGYPSIEDQLDTLYHGGVDAWKAQIKAVKDKYPKA